MKSQLLNYTNTLGSRKLYENTDKPNKLLIDQ